MSKIICVFGDSITEGHCDYEEGGWVNRLKKYLKSEGGVSVYNFGVSGDTTDGLLKRFDAEAEASNPEIIIFAIGINDSAHIASKNENYVPVKKFAENLAALSRKANAFTDKAVFVGITKVDEDKTAAISRDTDVSYRNKDIQGYDGAIKDFCEKNNLPFIEMYDLLDKEDLEDGLHPNSAGHEKMFQRVKDFLIENKIIVGANGVRPFTKKT